MGEQLKIMYLAPSELTPYTGNARQHSKEDVAAIVASIKEVGFCDPIGIWGDQNIIVEGHGRLMAANELGLETVPCIRLDHMTDEQRRAYALAHNKTAELSRWDDSLLAAELSALTIDMTQFGFDISALAGAEDEAEAGRGGPEKEFDYREQYAVTVMCRDESDQQEVYEHLTAEGYDCKVVCV